MADYSLIFKKNINILYLKDFLCHRRRIYSIQKRRQRSSLHLVLQIVLVQISLFFKSSWFKIASAARNWSSFVPQEAATTFAFFFCINPSSMFCVYTYFPASVHTWSSCTLVTPGISNTSRRSSSSTSSPSGTQFNRIQPEPLPHVTRGHTKDD